LNGDHTRELLIRTKEGNKEARETMVLENTGLIWCIVKRFSNRGYETEDLFQVGCIGLMKAIDKFDLSFDVKFSTYAVPMITGEIRRFIRDDGMIKVSRSLKENAYHIKNAKKDFAMKYQREATLEELSRLTGLHAEEIAVSLEANMEVESIYRPNSTEDGSPILLIDRLFGEENAENQAIHNVLVEQLMDGLDEMERGIIELRYLKGKTQQEVAKIFSVSQVKISRMEKKILGKMRKKALGCS
jgi:RNA polymerase sporulation-specific sigma factor